MLPTLLGAVMLAVGTIVSLLSSDAIAVWNVGGYEVPDEKVATMAIVVRVVPSDTIGPLWGEGKPLSELMRPVAFVAFPSSLAPRIVLKPVELPSKAFVMLELPWRACDELERIVVEVIMLPSGIEPLLTPDACVAPATAPRDSRAVSVVFTHTLWMEVCESEIFAVTTSIDMQ